MAKFLKSPLTSPLSPLTSHYFFTLSLCTYLLSPGHRKKQRRTQQNPDAPLIVPVFKCSSVPVFQKNQADRLAGKVTEAEGTERKRDRESQESGDRNKKRKKKHLTSHESLTLLHISLSLTPHSLTPPLLTAVSLSSAAVQAARQDRFQKEEALPAQGPAEAGNHR